MLIIIIILFISLTGSIELGALDGKALYSENSASCHGDLKSIPREGLQQTGFMPPLGRTKK